MFRKRRATLVGPDVRKAFEAFRGTLQSVEAAKRRLAAAAPGGRSAGIPLAEALVGFEEGLREASSSMSDWRVSEVEAEWSGCRAALDEASRLAEHFRLEGTPERYEELYGELADLIEPLDAFGAARRRFRSLGL